MIWFRKTSEPKFIITPGKGVEGCEIGFDKQTARDVFGRPQKEDAKYMHFYKHGLDVYTDFFTKKILSFMFYFESPEHRSLHINGDPNHHGRSRTSDGQAEDTLEYHELGVWYTFYNGTLADIRAFAPEQHK